MFLSILPGHYLQLDAEPGADLQHAAQLDSGSTMFEFHQCVSGDTAQRRGIVQLQAVHEGRAYALWHHFYNSPFNVAAVQVLAKWLHPTLFADIDPRATLQTLYQRFQPIPLEGTYWTAQRP